MISVGIDISKDKSTVCMLRPYGEVVEAPYSIEHTEQALNALIERIKSFDEDVKVVLEATGGYGGAGIGGGQHSSASDITITGGTITARGSNGGAGIGGGASDINGPYCNGSNITISGDAQVKAQGGTEHNEYNEGAGAGIGNGGKQGKNEAGKKVPVDGAEVEPDTSGLTEKRET